MARVEAYEAATDAAAKNLMDCVRRTKCSTAITGANGYSLIDCYCGTTEFGACSGGTAPGNGMCKAEVEAACKSTVIGEILVNITSEAFPAGLVNNVLACDDVGCHDKCSF